MFSPDFSPGGGVRIVSVASALVLPAHGSAAFGSEPGALALRLDREVLGEPVETVPRDRLDVVEQGVIGAAQHLEPGPLGEQRQPDTRVGEQLVLLAFDELAAVDEQHGAAAVSYTHLRAHEPRHDIV